MNGIEKLKKKEIIVYVKLLENEIKKLCNLDSGIDYSHKMRTIEKNLKDFIEEPEMDCI